MPWTFVYFVNTIHSMEQGGNWITSSARIKILSLLWFVMKPWALEVIIANGRSALYFFNYVADTCEIIWPQWKHQCPGCARWGCNGINVTGQVAQSESDVYILQAMSKTYKISSNFAMRPTRVNVTIKSKCSNIHTQCRLGRLGIHCSAVTRTSASNRCAVECGV